VERVAELHARLRMLELRRADAEMELKASLAQIGTPSEEVFAGVRDNVRSRARERVREAAPGPVTSEVIEVEVETSGEPSNLTPREAAREMTRKRYTLLEVERELNAAQRELERAEGMAAATSNAIGRELRDVMIVSEAWSSALDVVDRLDKVIAEPSKMAIYAVLKLEETVQDPAELRRIYTMLAEKPLPPGEYPSYGATTRTIRRLAKIKLAELEARTGNAAASRDAYLAILDELASPITERPIEEPAAATQPPPRP
jgi:hypothetical protein